VSKPRQRQHLYVSTRLGCRRSTAHSFRRSTCRHKRPSPIRLQLTGIKQKQYKCELKLQQAKLASEAATEAFREADAVLEDAALHVLDLEDDLRDSVEEALKVQARIEVEGGDTALGSGIVVEPSPVSAQQVFFGGQSRAQRLLTIDLLLAANAAEATQLVVPHISIAMPERRRSRSAVSVPDSPLVVRLCRLDLSPPRGDLRSSYGPVAGKSGSGARALPDGDKGGSDARTAPFRGGVAAGILGQ
jgi:hypothetical protein